MIQRVFFSQDVLLPNNRRERNAYRNAPPGHASFDLGWHVAGIELIYQGKVRVYPYALVEFIECDPLPAEHPEPVQEQPVVQVKGRKK